ncbi:MAG: DUF3488 and transglutaminase-like domain-containing protein, partial [Gammaproteobacteria bacterium]
FLGFFLLLAGLLHSQSIPRALALIPAVGLLTVNLLVVTHPRGRLRLAAAASQAGRFILLALPVCAVLFLLFPRLSGPLWGRPGPAESATTGLPDTIEPGAISQLVRSDAVAFRVTFHGRAPAPDERYWRIRILDRFDGRTWSAGRTYSGRLFVEGPAYRYTITLQPSDKRWLPALSVPIDGPPGSRLTGGLTLMAATPVRELREYDVISHTRYRLGEHLQPGTFGNALELPAGRDPRARALATRWRQQARGANDIVNRALRMFREQPFVYTLNPPPLGYQSVDDFLFSTRRGFCEHYASAFTFLMRAAGVPSRVVIGYQGGETNPMGDYLIVRQSDAHAWSEVWLKDRGWVRVDPTAAVAPERVEAGLDAALPAGERLGGWLGEAGWLHRLSLAWDAANAGWDAWFLAYGPEMQRRVLSFFGMHHPSLERMILAMVAASLLAGLVSAWLATRRLRPHRLDEPRRLYLAFCRRMRRAGLKCRANEGPLAFEARIARTRPDLAADAHAITRLYIDLRYVDQAGSDDLAELRRRVRRLRLRARPA